MHHTHVFSINKKVPYQPLLIRNILALFCIAVSLKPAQSEPITPFPADSFVDSIGVATDFTMAGTPYVTNWEVTPSSQDIVPFLSDLGVRHIRDVLPNPTFSGSTSFARARYAQLYRQYGIKLLTSADIRTNRKLDRTKIAALLADYANGSVEVNSTTVTVRSFLDGIEGPEDYDQYYNQNNRDPNWATNLKLYQTELYKQLKASSILQDLPALMPSLIYTQYCADRLRSFAGTIDRGNLSFFGTRSLLTSPLAALTLQLGDGTACFGTTPVWFSKVGYPVSTTGISGLTETTVAKYLPRLIAEAYRNRQAERLYLYGLADQGTSSNETWGLLGATATGQINDPYTLAPRYAYNALKGLLELLSESTWDATSGTRTTPTVSLSPFDIDISGSLPTTHSLLFKKSAGDFLLLLWQEVDSYNSTAGNVNPEVDSINVTLPTGYRFAASYTPSSQFSYIKLPLATSGPTSTFEVPDSVIVVEIAPINRINQAPTARNDVATVLPGGTVTIRVLANDTDPDTSPSPLQITSVTAGTKGTATIEGGKTLKYTALADASGKEELTYEISDGAVTTSAKVTITIKVAAAPTPTPTATPRGGTPRSPGGDPNETPTPPSNFPELVSALQTSVTGSKDQISALAAVTPGTDTQPAEAKIRATLALTLQNAAKVKRFVPTKIAKSLSRKSLRLFQRHFTTAIKAPVGSMRRTKLLQRLGRSLNRLERVVNSISV